MIKKPSQAEIELALERAGRPGGITPADLPVILGSEGVLNAIAVEIEALFGERLTHAEIEHLLRDLFIQGEPAL